MPELMWAEIAAAVGGSAEGADARRVFRRYHFDSRALGAGGLFFAVRSTSGGDGHRFLASLEKLPGAAAVIAADYTGPLPDIPLLRVPDPLAAAQELARYVRDKHAGVRYIGVTGSAGKTTTKEFIHRLLGARFRACRSRENWNNWLGLPFSLLNMDGRAEAAVFELGMSDPGIGEIDLLVSILRPDVAVVLNAYPVHLEFLKTVENVARAKAEILNRLGGDGTAVVNGDLDHLRAAVAAKAGRKVFFGRRPGNEAVLREVVRTGARSRLVCEIHGVPCTFECGLTSGTQLENLLPAILAAQAAGLKHEEIAAALETLEPVSGRGVVHTIGPFTVIDETYNSNPEAVKQTLAWIDREYTGEKTAVLGDMLELGEGEAAYHEEVGRFFAGLGFRRLITVGPRAVHIAAGARAAGFPAAAISETAAAAGVGRLLRAVSSGGTVLFKASRGVHLEIALEELRHE